MHRCCLLAAVAVTAALLLHAPFSYGRRLPYHRHPPPPAQQLQRLSRQAGGFTTTAPSPTTLGQLALVDRGAGIQQGLYTKHYTGRHVCTSYKNVTVPVQTKQPFCKPTYKKYTQKCNNYQLCTGVRLVYETAYRDVVTSKNTRQITYICCPGWSQVDRRSHGCNKPQCSKPCQNGGICVKPDLCSCPKGFTGRLCEKDIDECKEQKPCDQICHNTVGSFKCQCRENFTLQDDGQSCKKEGDDGTAFEARELQYEQLDKRIHDLEIILSKQLPNEVISKEIDKLNVKVENLDKDIDTLRKESETYRKDLRTFKDELYYLERRIKKVDEAWKRGEFIKKTNFLVPNNMY